MQLTKRTILAMKTRLKAYHPGEYARVVAERLRSKGHMASVQQVYNFFSCLPTKYRAEIANAAVELIQEARERNIEIEGCDGTPHNPITPHLIIYNQRKLGERIATLRKAKGLTQVELSYKCDMESTNIVRIETGYNPTLSTLLKISNGLGVEMKTLFE